MPASAPSSAGEPYERAVSALPAAMLLAAAGGILDAVVYLEHGHVFANAMTGNVVLLGISLVTADWSNILPHLVPVVAFLAGVLASRLLRTLPTHPSALAALGLEAVVLAGVALLPPSFPPSPFVSIVAFVSAFQVATFRRVGNFTYNSTFTTGNLRDTMDGLYALLLEPDTALRLQGGKNSVPSDPSAFAFWQERQSAHGLRLHLATTPSFSPNPRCSLFSCSSGSATARRRPLEAKGPEPKLEPLCILLQP